MPIKYIFAFYKKRQHDKTHMSEVKKKIIKITNAKVFIPLLIFILTSLVYTHNLSPSVFGGDSGDFLSAIAVRGVPHPSGYPLYTILGILFSYLPINATLAWKVGLISVISSSLTVVFVHLITYELINNKYLSLITSFTLAFTKPFWLYAEVVEVFALNSLFITILIYFSIRYHKYKQKKWLYYLTFFTSLSLTNNLVIVLLFPAIGILVSITNPKLLSNYKLILKCLLLFFLGLTPYVYIPIAASYSPPINWGNPTNIGNFISLITRKDYGWGIKDLENSFFPIKSLKRYFSYWNVYVNPLIPIISSLGVFHLFVYKKHKLLLFLFTAFIFLGPFFFIYARSPGTSLSLIGILERFLNQSFIIVLFLFPFGILSIIHAIETLVNRKHIQKTLTYLILATAAIIPISLIFRNQWKTNLRNLYIGDNFGKDVLKTLPKNSVLFVSSDNFIFNIVSVQYALNYRPDVLTPGRNTGYLSVLEKADMYNRNNPDTEIKKLVARNSLSDKYFFRTLVSLTEKSLAFVDKRVEISFTDSDDRIISVPEGLVYKLIFKKNFSQTKEEYLSRQKKIWDEYQIDYLNQNIEIISENIILTTILREYDYAYMNTANFLFEQYSDIENASKYSNMARALNPVFPSSNRPVMKSVEVENMKIKLFSKN